MSKTPKSAEPQTPAAPRPPSIPIIDAQTLFCGGAEVWIEHKGVRYRLRITRRNKLILQK
ncbi:MAG TPA: hemin uptake protein HemP [Gemmataceae bacterium]|nr:hemin uptake protein HemP [Gemmataceae bacterium]